MEIFAQPQFAHNNLKDVFLGGMAMFDPQAPNAKVFDLYLSRDEHGRHTVVARYGARRAEYFSGMIHSYGKSPSLTAARKLAIEQGKTAYDTYLAMQCLSPKTRKPGTTYTSMEQACLVELLERAPTSLEYNVYSLIANNKQSRAKFHMKQLLKIYGIRMPGSTAGQLVRAAVNNTIRVAALVADIQENYDADAQRQNMALFEDLAMAVSQPVVQQQI